MEEVKGTACPNKNTGSNCRQFFTPYSYAPPHIHILCCNFFSCTCTIIIIPTFTSLIDGLLKEVIGFGRLVEASGFELHDVVVSAGLVLGDVLLA